MTFACAPGKEAMEQSTRLPSHSPFTAAFLGALQITAGIKLKDLTSHLVDAVSCDTNCEQLPYVSGTFGVDAGRIVLGGSPAPLQAVWEDDAQFPVSPALEAWFEGLGLSSHCCRIVSDNRLCIVDDCSLLDEKDLKASGMDDEVERKRFLDAAAKSAHPPPTSATPKLRPKGPKVALCIGVGCYSHPSFPKLATAVNDASDMVAALIRRGYTVDLLLNEKATMQGMNAALSKFQTSLGPKGVAFFYFSGHGLMGADGCAWRPRGTVCAPCAFVSVGCAVQVSILRLPCFHTVPPFPTQQKLPDPRGRGVRVPRIG